MSTADLAKIEDKTTLAETIDAAFERRDEVGPATKGRNSRGGGGCA